MTPPRTLPLTVLAYDGPIARAYLARLRRAGLVPQELVLLVLSHAASDGGAVGRWLPAPLRGGYARRAQDSAQNFWPRQLRRREPALFEAVMRGLERVCEEPRALIEEMFGRFRFEDYARHTREVLVSGLGDPAIGDALSAAGQDTVLFTGGGIIPPALLHQPGRRFLHVHPGRLPLVRGADGLLWSTLVRGHPSTTCLYLDEGIDTGPALQTADSPALRFALPEGARPDDLSLYRALYSWCDPLLRAESLAAYLASTEAGEDGTPSAEYDAAAEDAGATYHFMHPTLRRRALEVLFVSGV